jgi:hypothetical protein
MPQLDDDESGVKTPESAVLTGIANLYRLVFVTVAIAIELAWPSTTLGPQRTAHSSRVARRTALRLDSATCSSGDLLGSASKVASI